MQGRKVTKPQMRNCLQIAFLEIKVNSNSTTAKKLVNPSAKLTIKKKNTHQDNRIISWESTFSDYTVEWHAMAIGQFVEEQ